MDTPAWDRVCEAKVDGVCAGRAAHWHHIKLRSRGGTEADGMMAVCFPCHDWIHGHPALATERGWMK